jgi:hypothetical protein
MRLIALVTLLLSWSPAHSEEQTIPVPGEGWRIRFESPQLTPIAGPVPSVFYGRADRFQLSFFVEKPQCDGPDTDENIYACHLKKVLSNPYVVRDSVRGNTTPNGVQTMALYRVQTAEGVGTNFSMNLLFARMGKWANVHASIASPKPEDVRALSAFMKSIKIEDEDVPSAASPSSQAEK